MQQNSLTYTQEIYDTGKGMQRKYRETWRGNEETEHGQVRGRTCCGADQFCKDHHWYSRGLGIVTVGGLIGEIGDFTKFTTQSEIAKLAGLDLYEVSSGKRQGERRISKRGRSLLRKILYYAAMQAIRKNGIMHDYYQKLISRGMKSIMALVAVSRKLLRIIFAIVRDDTEFILNHESQRKEEMRKAA